MLHSDDWSAEWLTKAGLCEMKFENVANVKRTM